MISKISGKLISIHDDSVTLSIDAFEYTVLIPEFARLQLQSQLGKNVSLHTIQYIDGNPTQGRLVPRLVGFTNEIEREFFELFCSVQGVGAKKALRAMIRPVPDVAVSIEQQDSKALSALPGIGPATAEKIIANLRRKMPKFALLITERYEAHGDVSRDVVEETFDVLRSLGHSETDARRLIEDVLNTKKKYKDAQAMIEAIYAQEAKK